MAWNSLGYTCNKSLYNKSELLESLHYHSMSMNIWAYIRLKYIRKTDRLVKGFIIQNREPSTL